MNFQEKLDEILFDNFTIRDLIKTTYEKISRDKETAARLYDEVVGLIKKDSNGDNNFLLTLNPILSNNLEMVKKSNEQLLGLLKIVERIINGGVDNADNKSVLTEEIKLLMQQKQI